MNTVMATWKKPVEVWGCVGAMSSEFQETTNWGRSSGEAGPKSDLLYGAPVFSEQGHVRRLCQQEILHNAGFFPQ